MTDETVNETLDETAFYDAEAANVTHKVLAFGDVHGQWAELWAALRVAGVAGGLHDCYGHSETPSSHSPASHSRSDLPSPSPSLPPYPPSAE